MSEEEIKILKVLINNKDVFYYEDDFNNRIRPLLGKLLNLYEAEKEKNKELEKADLTIIYMNGFYDGEDKLKNKIKEKIKEELDESKFLKDIDNFDGNKENQKYYADGYKDCALSFEEFLEEE